MAVPKEMVALYFHGPNNLQLDRVPVPEPKENEVLLEVAFCGICGSDLHIYQGHLPISDEPHPVTGSRPPLALGHEFAGTVVRTKSPKFQVGDRVAVEPFLNCHHCPACQKSPSEYNLCKVFTCIGFNSGTAGGLGAYCAVPDTSCFRLPDRLSFEEAAMVEPMAVAWHAVVKVGQFKPGQSALLLGAGPVGLFCIKVLKGLGASRIVVSEPTAARGLAAKKLGASEVVTPQTLASSSEEFDVVFECSGIKVAFEAGLGKVTPGGSLVVVAVHSKPVSVDLMGLVSREISVKGTWGYANDHAEVLAAIARGDVNFDDVGPDVIELADVVDKGFNALIATPDKYTKILVRPGGA